MPEAPWSLFVQPDQRSCGAASVVVARFLGDPDYRRMMQGGSLENPRTVAGDAKMRELFTSETLATHRRITGLADVSGRPQIPWPRTFGTPPWAVARELSSTPAADGTRASYSWHVARTNLPAAYQRLLDAGHAGRLSSIFVGTAWLPRHVALVVETTAHGTLQVYDPARGRVGELDRLAFLRNRIDIAGWDVAWFVITPDPLNQGGPFPGRRLAPTLCRVAAMSMNKVIHAAFRRDLDRFLGALGRFRDGDAVRAEQLGRAWDNFDFQLTKHHEGEHDIAWPALVRVGVTQQTLDQMDAEHDVMAERLSAARASMGALRAAPTAANAQTAHTAMDELRTVTTEHLDHEERELEPVYQAKYDDPAIKEMGRKFSKVGPQEGGVFFAWLTDGVSPEGQAGINATIPAPVRAIVSGLFGRSYKRDIAPVWRS